MAAPAHTRVAASAAASVAAFFVALFVNAAGTASCARSGWTLVEERFYALSLAGNPCGRSIERIERDGALFRTVSRIEMRFSRLGQETAIDLASEFVETERGDAVEATVRQKGADPVRYLFETQRRVRVERGAAREERELPGDDWLTPREASAFIAARGAAAAEELRFRTIDAQSGLAVVDMTLRRLGEREQPVAGRPVRLTEYEVRNSLAPIVARDRYDARGVLVESATPLGLGELVSRLATREEADASYAAASFDLLAGTFVKGPRIARYATLESLEFIVEATAGELVDLPSEGSQRFERISPRAARISVELARGSAAAAADATDPRWRKPTELVDSDSAEVRALLAEARLEPGSPRYERANALRKLVSSHLRRKDLGTAFGSASEAARTRGGDCTEHAVLLAALLRADGIPARVASGLVYVPDLGGSGPGWGWHLWTQALVEPQRALAASAEWTDFDATVSGEGRGYHCAHLLVATSDLAGGATDPAFSRALGLIGGIRIETAKPEGDPR